MTAEQAHGHAGPPEIHHETSDANITAVLGFALGLFVVAVVVHVLIYFLFLYFSSREAHRLAPQYPMAIGQEQQLPPEPRLQTNPREDLLKLREAEDAVLDGYGWVDRNAGIVRIPIALAMKLTLERGLPARQMAEPVTLPPDSGDANSGRNIGERRK